MKLTLRERHLISNGLALLIEDVFNDGCHDCEYTSEANAEIEALIKKVQEHE